MSAWEWVECPKGCHEDKNYNVVRVDLDWTLLTKEPYKAFVQMSFECQVCGLSLILRDEKILKKVVTDISYE